MTDSGSGHKKWYFVIGGAIAAFVAFLNSVFDLGDHIFGDGGTDVASSASAAPGTPTPPGTGVVSALPDQPAESTDPVPAGTVARRSETATAASQVGRSGPAWYDLTAYEAVSFGNGHTSVASITIGTTSFPNSIRGYYQSSASDPNDRRTWLTAGACDRLSVWVGKDAASSGTGGTGHFSVQAEGAEVAGADATLTDPPRHLDVDISGVSRLTLLDTKASRDANNAWGSPKVHCTAPPGKAR
ncbi:NPCBM/NEW2 domain-containing protein [Amycolatopsis sp. lyj-346]|uniref:NPCBM/NEW2 domain-containing protein n=1 Tax=Amycolatopsis sp. lyj-346 TaxID=2789289 RepID=UPI00397D53E2